MQTKNMIANTLPPDMELYNNGILDRPRKRIKSTTWTVFNIECSFVRLVLLYERYSSVEGSVSFEHINYGCYWASLVELSWEYIAEYHHTAQNAGEHIS